jgi:hypothetical protein
MGAKTLALGLIGLTAGVYFTPLCPNLEMLVVNGKPDPSMCSMEACCEAEEPEPNCCEPTERRGALRRERSGSPLPGRRPLPSSSFFSPSIVISGPSCAWPGQPKTGLS